MPQMTSANRGAMSKQFGAYPERQRESVPVAPHISTAATFALGASCMRSRNPPDPTSELICMKRRANVVDRPRAIIRSAYHPPRLAMTKYASHGAAERRPALASDALNVLLK